MKSKCDQIMVVGLPDSILRQLWDGIKHNNVQLICDKRQAGLMEQWRQEDTPANPH
jgi:hypothetical protein